MIKKYLKSEWLIPHLHFFLVGAQDIKWKIKYQRTISYAIRTKKNYMLLCLLLLLHTVLAAAAAAVVVIKVKFMIVFVVLFFCYFCIFKNHIVWKQVFLPDTLLQ